MVCFPYGSNEGFRHAIILGCCDRTYGVPVVLDVVVGVTIVEVHVPGVVAIVLSTGPLVTTVFLRLCTFVTEGLSPRSKPPIHRII